ncbi:MAG: hypothetical protein FWD60_06320 [Candidatus Azobacteroides sp.]|nr:hypothetical protein [Candidatus Azobacteroides sp.]
MTGFKDSFIGRAIFVQPQEEEKTQPASPAPQPTKSHFVPAGNTNENDTKGEVNQTIFNALCKIVDESTLPSPNYFDMKQNVDKLKTILTSASEDDLIKAAFVNLQMSSPSFSKSAISDSVDQYINIIMKQKDEENSILSQERKDKIDTPLSKATQIKAEIDDLNKKKDEIISQISKKNAEAENIANSIDAEKSNLSKKEQDLATTVDYFKNLLIADKTKILNALSNIK